MNCQAFRNRGIRDLDEGTLSHMETCDHCLVWMEEQTANDEEVRFLKDFPQPSVHLEDRIMKSIYDTIGQSNIPFAIADQGISNQRVSTEKSSKKSRYFLSTLTWVGAAGILLVAGLLTMQETLQKDSVDTASSVAIATQDSTSSANVPTQKTTEPPVQKSVETQGENTAQALTVEPAKEENATNSVTHQSVEPKKKEADTTTAHSNIKDMRKDTLVALDTPITGLPSRSVKNEIEPSKSLNPTNPDSSTNIALTVIPNGNVPDNKEIVTTSDFDSNKEALVALGETENTKSKASFVGPIDPTADQAAITSAPAANTFSTFTDISSAVQASDLAVPEVTKLPEGFALTSITLLYESETSKQVSNLISTYKHGDDFITVEVARNDLNKRTLSISGTFADRKLFTVNGNEAIGVTYDPNHQPSAAQHVIHFETTENNVPLYVIISTKGISLANSIEFAKQTTWQAKQK